MGRSALLVVLFISLSVSEHEAFIEKILSTGTYKSDWTQLQALARLDPGSQSLLRLSCRLASSSSLQVAAQLATWLTAEFHPLHATALFSIVLRRHPDYAAAHHHRGMAYLTAAKLLDTPVSQRAAFLRAACVDLKKAIALSPQQYGSSSMHSILDRCVSLSPFHLLLANLIYPSDHFLGLARQASISGDIASALKLTSTARRFNLDSTLVYPLLVDFVISLPLTFCALAPCVEPYYSQVGQDQWLFENVFQELLNGFFVEAGAADGVTNSNTLFFERARGWKGICVEPIEEWYNLLEKTRPGCHRVQGALGAEAGEAVLIRARGNNSVTCDELSGLEGSMDSRHLERIAKNCLNQERVIVPKINLMSLLAQFGLHTIDILSLDTEGGELDILSSIDFGVVSITAIVVENNYNDASVEVFLADKGFARAITMAQDDIFVRV